MTTKKVRIAFPEWDNPLIQEAIHQSPNIEAVNPGSLLPVITLEETTPSLSPLVTAARMVAEGQVDTLIAGVDYTSRDVILACRDGLGVIGQTFSSCFVLTRGTECYILADAATCKHPSTDQLYDIAVQTYDTALAVLPQRPRLAFLSFSTAGSGGRDASIEITRTVISRLQADFPDMLVDGEMQLDAAIVPEVGKKKFSSSQVAGHANVWIVPDINSGNILYKAMERFGGFTAAGPILQGFNHPCSDLSRGSTIEDILAVIEVERKLVLQRRKRGYPSIIPQISEKVKSFSEKSEITSEELENSTKSIASVVSLSSIVVENFAPKPAPQVSSPTNPDEAEQPDQTIDPTPLATKTASPDSIVTEEEHV